MHFTTRTCWLILLVATTLPTYAATFSVGSDWIGCTHRRLADAVAAAEANGPSIDTIRINSDYDGTNTALSIVGHSVRLLGGFSSCQATTATRNTYLAGTAGRRTITLVGYASRRISVEQRNLILRGNTPSGAGGGVAIYGNVSFLLRDSTLSRNRADRGGGLYVDGLQMALPADVRIENTLIERNFARLQGGGVYCRGGASIDLLGNSRIQSNGYDAQGTVVDSGGGAHIDNCTWHQAGGLIASNRARLRGGGMLAEGGSSVLMEWANGAEATAQPRVDGNSAGDSFGGGFGGAITVRGIGSEVALFGALLRDNRAVNGAAIAVQDGASLSMQSDSLCRNSIKPCSRLFLNSAYGVIPSLVEIRDGGSVDISQTRIEGNTADSDSARPGALFELMNFDPERSTRLTLHSTAITYNRAGRVISLYGSNHGDGIELVDAQFLTISGNHIDSVLASNGSSSGARIQLRASLINQPEPLRTTPAGTTDIYDCLLSASILGVPATRSVIASPMLGSNAMPLPGSPALDFCSSEGLLLDRGDLRNGPRPVDLIDVADRYGTIDVGAVERTALD